MISIIVNGAVGKMGKEVIKAAAKNMNIKVVAGVDVNKPNNPANFDFVFTDNFFDIDSNVDVIIDFSNPAALDKILEYATKTKTAVVLATTGYNKEDILKIKQAAVVVPIFFSFNMSIGINLLINLVRKAQSVLGDKFDIEIIEKHHNQKIDAPSGTALMIANALNEDVNNSLEYVYDRHSSRHKRNKNELGMHSIRGGTIVGEHEVIFAGTDEILTITHTATSKEIFAQGALKAAEFIVNKPAKIYDMHDLID